MLTVATFNVKDLFSPHPRLDMKLDEIAAQLRRADADVVALQEIASQEALHQVLKRFRGGADYQHVVLALPDPRGIRNAIVSRLPFVWQTVHMADALPFPIFREGDAPPFPKRIPLRRGVPHVRVDVPQVGLCDILTAHFKSKLPASLIRPDGTKKEPTTEVERAEGDVRSLVLRAAEALYVRGLIDAALAITPNVALMGDLNDTIESVPLQIVRGSAGGMLHVCAELVPKEARYSVLHEGRKQQIDHILVSPLLGQRLEAAAFQNESLRDHGPFVPGLAGTASADSDHALFVARFHSDRLTLDSGVNTQRSA